MYNFPLGGGSSLAGRLMGNSDYICGAGSLYTAAQGLKDAL
jgi:hypothetical protein